MNTVLVNIDKELNALAKAVAAVTTDVRPISIAHNNWQFPAVTIPEVAEEAVNISRLIKAKGSLISDEAVKSFESFVEKLTFLRVNTVPQMWGSPQVAVPAYLATLQVLRTSLENAFSKEINSSELAQATVTLKRVRQRLRTLEIALDEVEPKTVNLATMVSDIEHAHSAADQLPTDLEDLRSKQTEMAALLNKAELDLNGIANLKLDAGNAFGDIKATKLDITDVLTHANETLEKCESAYSASTSVGLGAAFSERSQALLISIRWWVAGLIAALLTGGYFGIERLNSMAQLLKDPKLSSEGIMLNLLLTLLSVGGSVWFAWLSTRQVGQRFKLAEDYAFKASISRAYEGYRKEANRIDPALEAKLLRSALDRLDEQPIRFVEQGNHASPLHEMLASETVRDAIKLIPEFATNVQNLAKDALSAVKTGNKAAPVLSTERPIKPTSSE